MRRAIACKRDGGALEPDAWAAIVAGYVAGRIDDAQLAALFMACVARGMDLDETTALARAYVASGETLATADARAVDKHSTGGVGDTASLVVVPLVAACGVPVAKLSGRALGHTGGTLDKLEAIPGVRTDLAPERFARIVRDVGCAIAAQSARLVPADGRTYALRDRTGTVPSAGLIVASIVAKKIAGGARAIVYDVKAGRGAFLPERDAAYALADDLVAVTERLGRPSVALVTDMEEPLGRAIGTGLEAIAARDHLRGDARDPRLGVVVTALAEALLCLAGRSADATAAVASALASGAAYERFERMVAAQGAGRDALASLAPHPRAEVVRAERAGVVVAIDPVALGEAARDLVRRCGPGAGIVTAVRAGDVAAAGDALATAYGEGADLGALARAFSIADGPATPRTIVYRESGSAARAAPATGAAGTGVAASSARSIPPSR